MAWNYRVFRTAYGGPHMEKQTEYWSIRDVYDREDGSIYALGGVAARLSGSTRTELLKDHALMHEAFAKPVLHPQDIPGYQYGAHEVPLENAVSTPHD